jgi:hypothetical protein
MQIQLLEQRADVAGRMGQSPVVLLLARMAVTPQVHRGSLFGRLIIGPADTRSARQIVGTAASGEGPLSSVRYDDRQGVRPAPG